MELQDNDPHAIAYVDLDRRYVVLNSGDTLPLTNMFDDDGEECEADSAVSIVAGTDDSGWYSVRLEWLEPATLQ